MSNFLFIVFSGQASAIFDDFLYINQSHYLQSKATRTDFPISYVIETQWDNGGHTGYLLDFYDWLRSNAVFSKVFSSEFLLPPPMGDLKTQISRWAKHLIESSQAEEISDLIGGRYNDPNQALQDVNKIINLLKTSNQDIFKEEDLMNFLQTFTNLYREFSENHFIENHSVGNLFLSFLYFYSYLIKDSLDSELYSHHHEVFFNFLKDLHLVPRGCRLEFLIDGRYILTAKSTDSIEIVGERYFDDYVGKNPIEPSSYSIVAVDGQDLDDKFREMVTNSDIVVIPPGSLSNWMPLINKFKEQLKDKPLIWIVNSFHHDSEVELASQIKYLETIGLNPIILAPKIDNPFDEIEDEMRASFEERYVQQRKTAEDFSSISRLFPELKIFRCIPLKELEPGEGGIKYSSKFIKQYLSEISINLAERPTYEELVELSDRILFRLSSKDLTMK